MARLVEEWEREWMERKWRKINKGKARPNLIMSWPATQQSRRKARPIEDEEH